jgi:hypothetical protein
MIIRYIMYMQQMYILCKQVDMFVYIYLLLNYA